MKPSRTSISTRRAVAAARKKLASSSPLRRALAARARTNGRPHTVAGWQQQQRIEEGNAMPRTTLRRHGLAWIVRRRRRRRPARAVDGGGCRGGRSGEWRDEGLWCGPSDSELVIARPSPLKPNFKPTNSWASWAALGCTFTTSWAECTTHSSTPDVSFLRMCLRRGKYTPNDTSH